MTLKADAETIRDETETGANSASRVGTLLVSMAERLEAPAIGQIFMVGNAATTTPANTTDFVKIQGTTTDNDSINSLFDSPAANRLRYIGAESRLFVVDASISVFCDHGGHIVEAGLYVSSLAAVNADVVGRSAIHANANDPTQICARGVYVMDTNDYIEVHLRGVQSAEAYTVSNLNLLITEA